MLPDDIGAIDEPDGLVLVERMTQYNNNNNNNNNNNEINNIHKYTGIEE